VITGLEIKGLVNVDVGMAEFHLPEAPSPMADNLYVTLTDAGRQTLAELTL
jgi:hypothetical protein